MPATIQKEEEESVLCDGILGDEHNDADDENELVLVDEHADADDENELELDDEHADADDENELELDDEHADADEENELELVDKPNAPTRTTRASSTSYWTTGLSGRY